MRVLESKSQLVLSSFPGRGACHQSSVGLRVEAWGIDSERCLELDSDWRPAKPPTFTMLLGGRRGSWYNLELSWQRVTGLFFSGCLRRDELSDRNLPLFPKILVNIAL